MNKFTKALKALHLIIQSPYLLNHILNSEEPFKKRAAKHHQLQDGFPTISLSELFTDFHQTVSPYAFLSGATTPIDLALLNAIAQKYKVENYFEIGTWRGESVSNVASFVPHCFTFNLPKEEILKLTNNPQYSSLHGFFSLPKNNIQHLYGNSCTFDFTPYYNRFDLVFIDGDHHYEAVKRDTITAFKLLKNDQSIIIWHDYGFDAESIRWSVLCAIFEGTPEEKRKHLYHVGNTMCAIYLPEEVVTAKLNKYEIPKHYFSIDIQLNKL